MSKIFGIYLAGICSAVLLAAILTPLVRIWAIRQGLVDQPGARKVHTKPIARLGGIAIFLAYMLSVATSLLLARGIGENFTVEAQGLIILLSGAAIFGVGILDDLYALSGKLKFLVLLIASAMLCKSGVMIDQITISGLGINFELGVWAWPVTILWVVAITVAVNFMDGLDGLAAGIVAIAAGTLSFWLAQLSNPVGTMVFSTALFGGLLGFLVHNRHPASIFMGDGGSMFIGFSIASFTVLANQPGQLYTTQALILPALALSVPLVDLGFTVIRRRFIQRRSIFAAERGHIHHQLLDLGLPHGQVVLLIHGVTLAAVGFGSFGLLIGGNTGLFAFVLVVPLIGGLFRAAGSARARKTLRAIASSVKHDREVKDYQGVFDEMQLRFNKVKSFDDWWRQVVESAEMMDFLELRMIVPNRDGSTRILHWQRAPGPMNECDTIDVTVPIHHRRTNEPLRLEIKVSAPTTLEAAGRRVAWFARLMEDHSVKRMAGQLVVAGQNYGIKSEQQDAAEASAVQR